MDQMVLKVQQWLNSTYGDNLTEDGTTGGKTVAALIKALQIEIGVPSPDGVFGKATFNACPTIYSQYGSKNEVYIVQGALYCKGYDPSGFDGGYGPKVTAAIARFQADAGLTNQDGKASPMILQALLNTDAYILISGGDSKMRTIQQNLNRDYNSVIGLIPTNGVYERSTNTALIKALQHEEGNTPDGIWGTNTKNACPTIPGSRSTRNFVLLLQYALYCNGYDPNGFDGAFGSGLQSAIRDFQSFVGLSADGSAGAQTWASLLVSYGDPSRKGIACDCSTTITSQKAATLIANGYKIIGRYLTGKYAMTSDELAIIFSNNMKVIPIFEVGGYKLSYFNYLQGMVDAEQAVSVATNLNIFDNTIIYFAVDFDALDQDVTNNIIPYFKAINDKFSTLMTNYKIGIYAPRNVCSRVSIAGYSCSSFVCDMSSGFSGNLGYKIPMNWAFDQISTNKLGTGLNYIEIDNNISSEKNQSPWMVRDITQTLKALMVRYQYMYMSSWSKESAIEKVGEFYELVRNKGPLDLKNQGWNDKCYVFDGKMIRGDAPGNILYGYLGKVFGFSDELLCRAAGYAQTKAGTSDPSWGTWYGNPPYGDDPEDQKSIKIGIDYYNKYNK